MSKLISGTREVRVNQSFVYMHINAFLSGEKSLFDAFNGLNVFYYFTKYQMLSECFYQLQCYYK